jgi:hypothetical protein
MDFPEVLSLSRGGQFVTLQQEFFLDFLLFDSGFSWWQVADDLVTDSMTQMDEHFVEFCSSAVEQFTSCFDSMSDSANDCSAKT